MLLGPGWDDAQAATRPSTYPSAARTIDHRRVNFVFGAVAIDRGSRCPGNHGAAATLERAPYQPVHQRVFENSQRRFAAGGESNQPVGIVAARVRHGEQDGEVPARLVDDWGGELAHRVRVKFRTSLGLAKGACNA